MSKTYQEKEIRKIFNDQGYLYACLKDANEGVRITYNTIATKNGALAKLNEAFKRLQNMPDGIYHFCFLNSKGRNVTPDVFPYLKGNIVMEESGKVMPYQIVNQLPAQQKNEYDKMLSYPEVMTLQLNLTTLNFQLDATRKELEKANITIKELESDLKAVEAKELSEGSSPMGWLENVSTTLLPVLDRFMTQRDKDLALRAREQNNKFRKGAPQQKSRVEKTYSFPIIGSEEWEQWLDVLENASDEDYNYTLALTKKQSPEHYNAAIEALEGEEEEQGEN